MIKEYSEGMVENNGKKKEKKRSHFDKTLLNCLKDFGITLVICIFFFLPLSVTYLLFYDHTL